MSKETAAARKYEAIQTPRQLDVIAKARKLAVLMAAEMPSDPRPIPIYMAVATAIEEAIEDRS